MHDEGRMAGHAESGEMHVMTQPGGVPVQAAIPPSGTRHAAPQAPQLLGSDRTSTQAAAGVSRLHSVSVGGHRPHPASVHALFVPLIGVVQGVHDVPHELADVLLKHCPWQR
jgi:hypothetical protein